MPSKNKAGEPPVIKYEPSISLKLKKESCKGMGMGEKVMASVSGTIVGMRKCFDDNNLVEVELKPFTVKNMGKDMEDEEEDEDDTDAE